MIAAVTGLIGLFDPVITSLLVSRVMKQAPIERVAPVFITLLAVKGTRIYARITMSRLLGNNQRAPINWLRRRIGSLIWWMEPLFNSWGPVGVLVNKLVGPNGITAQVASGIIYLVTDFSDSAIAGFIFYLTQDYILSFCSSMILPTLFVLPWFTRRSHRILRGGKIHMRHQRR